jgi:hypothetical protein
MAQEEEHLFCKFEALSSKPRPNILGKAQIRIKLLYFVHVFSDQRSFLFTYSV